MSFLGDCCIKDIKEHLLSRKTSFCLNAHSGSLSEATSTFRKEGRLDFHSSNLLSRFMAICDISLVGRFGEW